MKTNFAELDRRMEAVRERFMRCDVSLADFKDRLDFSWIYHDHALEGVVLSYHELKAAIDKNIISDVSLIPSYTDIKNHKLAIELVREAAARRRGSIGLDFLKRLHEILNADEPPQRSQKNQPKPATLYRRDNPLHRLYFHEIAPPEKIIYRIRKLADWLGSEEARRTHPVKRATKAHFRLIGIFPWPKHSGRIARLLMNAILLREGYLPAIIHAIERQRYYDSLRAPHSGLTTLMCESIMGTIEAADRFVDESTGTQPVVCAAS